MTDTCVESGSGWSRKVLLLQAVHWQLGSLPAGVMESFQGPEVSPCRGKAILQKLPAALARGLEQLYVASQPGLKRGKTRRRERDQGASSAVLLRGLVAKDRAEAGLDPGRLQGPIEKLSDLQACLPVMSPSPDVPCSSYPKSLLPRAGVFPKASWSHHLSPLSSAPSSKRRHS